MATPPAIPSLIPTPRRTTGVLGQKTMRRRFPASIHSSHRRRRRRRPRRSSGRLERSASQICSDGSVGSRIMRGGGGKRNETKQNKNERVNETGCEKERNITASLLVGSERIREREECRLHYYSLLVGS